MLRRLVPFVALSLASLIAVGGCGSDAETSAEPDPEWLFSLQATGMTAFDEATGQLTMPVDSVLAFTDRPDRYVDLGDPQSFADLWNDEGEDSFEADPPNIVISWWPAGGGYADSMEVASIVGAVTYDPATSSLLMTLAADGEMPLTLPAAMDQASLFVDGYSSDCGSQSATVSTPRGTSPICITPTQF